MLSWIFFIVSLPFRIITYIPAYLLSLVFPSPTLVELRGRGISSDSDAGRDRVAFDTWESPLSYSPPPSRSSFRPLMPTQESVFTISVRPHQHTSEHHSRFQQPLHSPHAAMERTRAGIQAISAPARTTHKHTAGPSLERSRASISLPPQISSTNLSRKLDPEGRLSGTGVRVRPGVVKPVHFDPIVRRTARRLRDTTACIYFYRTSSDRRIDYPVKGGDDAQEGDIYLNWVDSEMLAQLWLRQDRGWVKVGTGHRVVIPPEREERYLVVSLGGQPSYVRRRTWVGLYKCGEKAYCPAIRP